MGELPPYQRPVPRRLALAIRRSRWLRGLLVLAYSLFLVWAWDLGDLGRRALLPAGTQLLIVIWLFIAPYERRRAWLAARRGRLRPQTAGELDARLGQAVREARSRRLIAIMFLVLAVLRLALDPESAALRLGLLAPVAALLLLGLLRTVIDLRQLEAAHLRRDGLRGVFS